MADLGHGVVVVVATWLHFKADQISLKYKIHKQWSPISHIVSHALYLFSCRYIFIIINFR